jgi:hypothetical protein
MVIQRSANAASVRKAWRIASTGTRVTVLAWEARASQW